MKTFGRDERHVDPHRLLDADRDEHRQDGYEQEGRQVEVRAVGDRLDRDAEPLEENPEIGRTTLRDHRGAEHELEQQVQPMIHATILAERGVEGVGRSRHGDRGRELA